VLAFYCLQVARRFKFSSLIAERLKRHIHIFGFAFVFPVWNLSGLEIGTVKNVHIEPNAFAYSLTML
jgi:hypothetical protein